MTPIIHAPDSARLHERISPHLREVLRELGRLASRQRMTAYAVGGCVRDWSLGRPVEELDVMVEGDSLKLAQAFATSRRGTLAMHPQFGTAIVEYRRGAATQRLDLAMCRKETYAEPAAYPTVTRGSLTDDLFRRDFTINAMAMQIKPKAFGAIVDLFGGRRDLESAVIRVLHPHSFRDDPSRLLRAIRFAQRLHFTIEPETAALMRTALREGYLARLNRGRLRKELLAMLDEPDPLGCLRSLGQWLLGAEVR